MTLEEALAHPASRKVLLVTLVAGEHLYAWTDNGDGTFTAQTPREVVGLRVDGADQTPGWTWDRTAGTVTVDSAVLGDPREHVVLAMVALRFATEPKVFDEPWWPRVERVPDVSLRTEAEFGGLTQIGGGTLELANGDGFFDGLELDWAAGWCELKLGVDLP